MARTHHPAHHLPVPGGTLRKSQPRNRFRSGPTDTCCGPRIEHKLCESQLDGHRSLLIHKPHKVPVFVLLMQLLFT